MAPLTLESTALDAAAGAAKAQGVPSCQAVITLPSSSPAPPVPAPSVPSATVFDQVASELSQLREDLLSVDPRLVAGRLELASGWARSAASVRAALSQAVAASDGEKQAANQAKAARDAALGDAAAAKARCEALETELQGLRDELAKEVHGRQEKEKEMKAREAAVKDRDVKLGDRHGRLETLERSLKAERTELDAKAKVLAEDRVAFAKMEKRARAALKTLYESGLEEPLAGAEDGPAKLLPFLVRALEDVVDGLGPTAEAEARALSSAALTHVLSHVYLRDPDVDFDSLLEPVSGDLAAAAAEAVKGRAEALLGRFRAFSILPGRGAASSAAPGGGATGE